MESNESCRYEQLTFLVRPGGVEPPHARVDHGLPPVAAAAHVQDAGEDPARRRDNVPARLDSQAGWHGLGHSSLVFMIEAQVRYVVGAVAHASARGVARIEVRPAARAAYDQLVQQKMRRTVWVTGGCKSWYLDASGRNVTLWPGFTWDFAKQTRRFDPDSYDTEPG